MKLSGLRIGVIMSLTMAQGRRSRSSWAAGRSLHTSPSPSSFRFRKRVVAIDLGVDLRRDSNGIERDFVGRARTPRSPKFTYDGGSLRQDRYTSVLFRFSR